MEKESSYIKRAKDLEVYRRAYAVSLEVHKATLVFPKIEQYALADQMRRSSKAICANLAEGFAKQTHSKPEFARFISMAMGSCSEVETWIFLRVRSWLHHTSAARRMAAVLCSHLWNAGESEGEAEVSLFFNSSILQFFNSPFHSSSRFGRISAYGPRAS